MGGQTSGEQQSQVAAYVAGLVASLDALEANATTGQDTTRRRIRSVVEGCGAEKRTRRLLGELSDALDAAGLYFHPDVTDIRLSNRAWVTFSRRPLETPPDPKALFPAELGLELFLADNLAFVDGLAGLRFVATQYKLPSGERIDMLCEDPATGQPVVVELKRAMPGRAVFEQVLDYVEELRSVARYAKHTARAVIITGHGDHELQTHALSLATAVGVDLSWHTYDVTVTLSEVASTGAPEPRPRPEPASRTPPVRVEPDPDAAVGHYGERVASPERPWAG